VNGWRFHPLVKQGHWDGCVSYLIKDKFIPAGLWKEITDICKKYNFDIEIDGIRRLFDNSIKYEEFEEWVKAHFKDFNMEIRSYQIEAAYKVLKNRVCVAELATSAGKTLISYIIVSYLLQKELCKKILFIVPSVSLVTQGVGDFKTYARFVENPVKIKFQEVYSGQAVKPEYNFVIGTYQSLSKKSKEYFDMFDSVIVDECLHPDTLIKMSDGLSKKIKDIKEGEWVKTTNDDTLELEDNQVEYIHKNLSQGNQMFEIEVEDGTVLKITGNHKVKLLNGLYKRVDELTLEDEILSV
jgi:primosomal protein N'